MAVIGRERTARCERYTQAVAPDEEVGCGGSHDGLVVWLNCLFVNIFYINGQDVATAFDLFSLIVCTVVALAWRILGFKVIK